MEGLEKELELRMYFFTIYQLTGIQKGIQCGHALGRYALKYGRYDPNHIVWDYLEKWETFIILNGGTTNNERDFESISVGDLNRIADDLLDNDIEFAYMIEPDLNNALSAVCFILDERVFNRKDYPDFVDYLFDVKMYKEAKEQTPEENYRFLKKLNNEELQGTFPEYWKEWVRFVGGVKNVFLRELINNKKLA